MLLQVVKHLPGVFALAVLLGFNDKQGGDWQKRLAWLASLPMPVLFFMPIDSNGNGATWVRFICVCCVIVVTLWVCLYR